MNYASPNIYPKGNTMNYSPNYDFALVMSAPEPVLEHGTDTPKPDSQGRPQVQLDIAFGGADARGEVARVRVPTTAVGKGVKAGTPVRFVGLVATYWAQGGRSGMSLRAEGIEAAATPAS